MKTLTNTFLILLLFTACSKYKIESSAPECLKSIAKERSKNCTGCTSSTIDEYKFQGDLVYVYSDQQPEASDIASYVYDTNCELLATLGGVAGITKINNEDFSNAIFLETVWTIDHKNK